MPRLIDYPDVVANMTARGLVCLYPNSGAFGFTPGVATTSIGWIGPEDASIRPAARSLARMVPAPYEANLAAMALRAWRDVFGGGEIWVLPKAHWAYELMFGSHEWMPDLLEQIGIASPTLAARHDGSALAFSGADAESGEFILLVQGLLERLLGSDFLLAFPNQPAVCTIHHHKQLWWTTANPLIHGALRELVDSC